MDKITNALSLMLEGLKMQMSLIIKTEINTIEYPNINRINNKRMVYNDFMNSTHSSKFSSKELSRDDLISMIEKTYSDCQKLICPESVKIIIRPASKSKDNKMKPFQDHRKLNISSFA